ncbi:MAG: hypothetical protein V4696_01495 [Pseudomonadota bacterium]
MLQPALLPLVGNRWTPFVYSIDVVGIDLSDAAFKAQVRLGPGTPGTPLVDLANATAGTQGISVTVATVGGVTTSTVTMRINEPVMEGLPAKPGAELGDDAVLFWDLHVTAQGLSKAVYFRGPFIVKNGATQ